MPLSVFLTGCTGFVGGAIQQRLLNEPGHRLTCTRRGAVGGVLSDSDWVRCDDFACDTGWQDALAHVDVVIHAAARVHVMDDQAQDPLAAFRQVNVEGTMNLARHARAAGVKRFVFISSIKVNGEGTARDVPYHADDTPAPVDPYGVSKYEAEQQLLALAAESAMEVVIIRPVLVYGPGVKANFRSMMRWLDRAIVLPFGAVDNRRSLVALDNLVDFVMTCLVHPAAANERFLISDGEDLSTTQLLRRMASALGRPARLLPVPVFVLRGVAMLLGRAALSNRLCGSLTVDINKNRELLGWVPPIRLDAALRVTAQHYKNEVLR